MDKETIVQGSLLCQAGGTQSLRPYHIWASMGSTKADRESDPAAIIAAVHDLVGKPGMALLDTLIPRRD